MNFAEFIRMNGYAAYVWSSYGLTLIVLVVIAWSGRRSYAEMLAAARRRLSAGGNSKL